MNNDHSHHSTMERDRPSSASASPPGGSGHQRRSTIPRRQMSNANANANAAETGDSSSSSSAMATTSGTAGNPQPNEYPSNGIDLANPTHDPSGDGWNRATWVEDDTPRASVSQDDPNQAEHAWPTQLLTIRKSPGSRPPSSHQRTISIPATIAVASIGIRQEEEDDEAESPYTPISHRLAFRDSTTEARQDSMPPVSLNDPPAPPPAPVGALATAPWDSIQHGIHAPIPSPLSPPRQRISSTDEARSTYVSPPAPLLRPLSRLGDKVMMNMPILEDSHRRPSTLMTSEPLNRSPSKLSPADHAEGAKPSSPPVLPLAPTPAPSHMMPPHEPSPQAPQGHINCACCGKPEPAHGTRTKRARANSLPIPMCEEDQTVPQKRVKTSRAPARIVKSPSIRWTFTLNQTERGRRQTILAFQMRRAQRLGEQLVKSRVFGRSVEMRAPSEPPINSRMLSVLDHRTALACPQRQHDLLFEDQCWRPSERKERVLNPPTTGGPGETAQSPDTEMTYAEFHSMAYWEAMRAEIETGCRCTRYVAKCKGAKSDDTCLVREKAATCLCGGWVDAADEVTDAQWLAKSAEFPSRLPRAIRALREILATVVGCTEPCSNPLQHKDIHTRGKIENWTAFVNRHPIVQQLYASLDPEWIFTQARRRVLDPKIFEVLADTVKIHCAPLRDAIANEMVQVAKYGKDGSPDFTGALKMAFELLELMKLDVANHHLHLNRPVISAAAREIEWATFTEILKANNVEPAALLTKSWTKIQGQAVRQARSASEQEHLEGKCLHRDLREWTIRSVVHGWVDLVSRDWEAEGPCIGWPPVVSEKITAEWLKPSPILLDGIVPETLIMDKKRIIRSNAELHHIAVRALMLLCVRDLYTQHGHAPTSKSLATLLDYASPLLVAMYADDVGNLVCPLHYPPEECPIASTLAMLILMPSSRVNDEGHRTYGELYDELTANQKQLFPLLTDQISIFMATHGRADSPLYHKVFTRIRETYEVMLSDALLDRAMDELDPLHSERMCAVGPFPKCQQTPAASPEPKNEADKRQVRQELARSRKETREALMKRNGIAEGTKMELEALVEYSQVVVGFNIATFAPIYQVILEHGDSE